MKTILYYTDNTLDDNQIGIKTRHQLLKANLPIVSVSLKPINFGINLVLNGKRGFLTMVRQILLGLEAIKSPVVFFCEHDVLYHPTHFDFYPDKDDIYYYNTNVWKVRAEDGHCLWVDNLKQLSGLCANRELLLQHYQKRVKVIERSGYSTKIGHEPGTHNRPERIDDYKSQSWQSQFPNLDIRHKSNITSNRWSRDQFRNQQYTKGWTESNKVEGWNIKEVCSNRTL